MRPSLARVRRSERATRGRAHAGVSLGLAAVAAVVFSQGCGEPLPPTLARLGVVAADGGATAGSVSTISLDPSGAAPPSCEAGTQGGVCGCLDLTLLEDPPNLYFVLDRSGSMNDDGKWTTIRSVIGQLITDLGPRAQFGAAVFPNPASDESCAVGIQAMSVMPGDAPAGTAGPTEETFIKATNFPAGGGTPTAATFNVLSPALVSLAGKTFVILATDGGPNCDTAISCTVSACTANIEGEAGCTLDGPSCCTGEYTDNCLDSVATVQAVTALAALGVPTYVVGVPGSGPYAGLLDQLALAGGTARPSPPYYYPVDSADQSDFTTALRQVAAKITASCTLTLSQAPPDPTQVNLYLDGVVVPQSPTNGWTLSGTTVTLEGTTCQQVLAGDSLDLRIVAGCPTILQ